MTLKIHANPFLETMRFKQTAVVDIKELIVLDNVSAWFSKDTAKVFIPVYNSKTDSGKLELTKL